MDNTQVDLDKVKDKLAKLLRLQEGANKIGSLEEAATAAAKIQSLLFKYNLAMADISSKENTPEVEKSIIDLESMGRTKTSGKWMEALANVLARHNLCKVVLVAQTQVYIFGQPENVKVVSVLFTQLVHRLKGMSKQAFKDYNGFEKKNTFLRGYLLGAVRGIDTKLTENKREMEAKEVGMTAMVLASDKLVTQAVENHFSGGLKKGKASKVSGQDGLRRGFKDGKEMSFNKSIE